MIVSAKLVVGQDCPQCKLAVPINAIAASTRCNHCGSHISLDWTELLDLGNPKINALDRALALKPGKSDTSAFAAIHLEVTREEPHCQACNAPLVAAELIACAQHATAAACARCHAAIRLRAAPPELVAAYPAARALAHESVAADDPSNPREGAKQTLVFGCMTCGGGLELDGSERVVTCKYCQASNYLPDGVWLRLHPPQKREPFIVLCDVEAPELFATRYRDGGRAARDAPRTDLEPIEVLALAHSHDASVQRALAANPTVTADALRLLAATSHADVRDAVASSPRATPEVIAAMAAAMEARVAQTARKDDHAAAIQSIARDPRATPTTLATLATSPDAGARAGVAGNPKTPPTLLASLATDGDADVRVAIATRSDAPPELLSALADDSNVAVLRAVAAHPSTPPDALARIAKSGDDEARKLARAQPRFHRKWWDVF